MEKEYENINSFLEDVHKENLDSRLKQENNYFIIKPTQEELDLTYQSNTQKSNPGNACGICNSKFYYGRKNSWDCGCCKLYIICGNCNKIFLFNHYVKYSKGWIYKSIENKQDIELYCCYSCHRAIYDSKESTKKMRSDMIRKRWEDKDSAKAMMSGIIKYRKDSKKVSEATKNMWAEPEMRSKFENHLAKLRQDKNSSFNIQFCKECDKETRHNGLICLTCNPLKLRINRFRVVDKTLYFLDPISGQYELWNSYKEGFISAISDISINFLEKENLILFTTFREKDSESWCGRRLAFEQNLVDNSIEWFVYIKFFKNKKGDILPLVVGKSGSKLVNQFGSDLSFSVDIKDGPARRFLYENNYEWDKTTVAIRSFVKENEALEFEKYLTNKYRLLQS